MTIYLGCISLENFKNAQNSNLLKTLKSNASKRQTLATLPVRMRQKFRDIIKTGNMKVSNATRF